jgi:acyl-CoA synthetase (AMP-forming)/AMP-acid ligase II
VLRAQHEAIKAVFPPWAGQRDFPLFPNILLHNMAAGVISILPDVPWCATQQLEPARVLDQLERERVETMTGNVFYFDALLNYLRQHPRQLPEVVAIGIGGSPVPEPLVQELKQFFPSAAIHIIYGSSEAEPIAVRQVGAQTGNPLAGYCVGSVHPALEVQICPLGQLSNGQETGPMVGEIQVRGPHVATAQPGQWLATGDYGYLADGQLFLTGRQGNECLHGGVQHYQLEHLLYHLPGVERVAARSDAAGFTIFIQGPTVSRQDVEELLTKTFHGTLSCTIHFRSSLPVDSRHHSKILYAQLS